MHRVAVVGPVEPVFHVEDLAGGFIRGRRVPLVEPGRFRGRLRGDFGHVRFGPVVEPVLPARLRHSVPLRSQVGQIRSRQSQVHIHA